MVNWAQLLPDLLTVIARKVDMFEDFIAFSGVCRSWKSVAVKGNFNQQLVSSSPCSSRLVQPPWLMLAEKEGETTRGFVSMSRGGMIHKVELPEAKGKLCIGSHGWLITLDEEGGMELLHPLTRSRICLPHLSTFTNYERDIEENGMDPVAYLYRATLSASPSTTGDYAVMLILGIGFKLALWKPGDKVWTLVHSPSGFVDVIYHKDKLYATDSSDNVVVCDVRVPKPTIVLIGRFPMFFMETVGQLYWVECRGDLLMVKKEIDHLGESNGDMSYRTTGFKVWRAVDSTSMTNWQEVKDLADTSIFVGHNTAISVPCAKALGIKSNCIYFTDDYGDGYFSSAYKGNFIAGKDMGIYNLGSGSIEPLIQETSVSKFCPPIWVSPSF